MSDKNNNFNIGDLASTASAYSAESEELREQKRKWKLLLFKLGAMGILTAIIIIVGSIAWFTMSEEVEGTGARMTGDDLPFELEVRGTKIENQPIFSKVDDSYILGVQQEDDEGTPLSYYQTTGDETHGTILWNKDASADGSYPNGLEPNAHGTLTFWIIPKKSGELKVNFNFNIRGYHAKYTQDEAHTLVNTLEITDDLDSMTNEQLAPYNLTTDKIAAKKKALEYIQGHILFFKDYSDGHYSGFLGNAGNKIAFVDCLPDGTNNVTAGQKYQVTVYWKWANTLEQAVSYADSPLLDSAAESFDTDQAAILSYLADYTHHKVFEGISDNNVITTNIGKLQNSDSTDDKAALTALTDKYNNADEVIGNNLYYILIEMITSST